MKKGLFKWIAGIGIAAAIFTPIALLNGGIKGDATPMLVWGNVQIDAVNAPAGTIVDIYIGDDVNRSGTFVTRVAGQYGAVVVMGDNSKYGQPLRFTINGKDAFVVGGEAYFGLKNQTAHIALSTAPASKTWVFNAPACVPRHLPDSFVGAVVLDELSDVPVEIQGVYCFKDNWQEPEKGEWIFWAFGAPACTLKTLGGGHSFDYFVCSTGACEWEISLD
jgi:hypothetical protein